MSEQERIVRASMAQPRVMTIDPGVQVEQAPPLRTWSKIDGPPAGLLEIELLDADDNAVERWTRPAGYGGYWTDPTGRLKRQTWSQIRARGKVREVRGG
jgi:hypothetical protein